MHTCLLMEPIGARLVCGQNFRILIPEKQAKLISSFSSLPKSVLEEATEPVPATSLWHSFAYTLYILSLPMSYKCSSQSLYFYCTSLTLWLKKTRKFNQQNPTFYNLLTLKHSWTLSYCRDDHRMAWVWRWFQPSAWSCYPILHLSSWFFSMTVPLLL